MNKVLDTTKFVVENAENVTIDQSRITDFCENFSHRNIRYWLSEAPFDFTKLTAKDQLHFLLVFNSISFCYWGEPKWTIEYKNKSYDGSWGMIIALRRAIESGFSILQPEYLANMKKDDFQKITKANVSIPLLQERFQILQEVGETLTDKFQGDFSKLLKQAQGDALKLLDLLVFYFPSFVDSATYKNNEVFFYKRAQLLISDIFQFFQGKNYGNLKNIKQLSACADYKIPQVLRNLEILSFSKELANKIDSKIQIPKGSDQEIEIRASTIQAVELIKKNLQKKLPEINSIHVNDHLWLLGQEKLPEAKPYHLTRTTCY